jgi:hypothetical protein
VSHITLQKVGHITLSDVEYTIRCFRTLFIAGHIITQKVFEFHGAEMYDYLSELTNISFLSCRSYHPQSGDAKYNM